MHNPKQPDIAAGNGQTVQAVSKQTSLDSEAIVAQRAKTRLASNNLRYWEGRLYQESYIRDGERCVVPELYVKLNHAGRRRAFNLGTANKVAAASKAREISQHLEKAGWEETLEKYSPSAKPATATPTLAEFLAEVQRTGGLKPRTFHRYSMYLRSIVAHVGGIGDKAGRRFDYRTGGRAAWAARIDAVPLEKLTPELAADWKADYLARAGNDPLRRIKTARAFNAALRSAKSLFSSRIIQADNFRVRLPRFPTNDPQSGKKEIYWFDNLSFEKSGSMKFSPPEGVTYQTLIVAARRELRDAEPDAYLLLLLCLCAGLRRAEADVLRWDQVHYGSAPEDCYLLIEANEFIQPKHGSGGLVYAEPELIKELLAFKARSAGSFVVNSPMEWKQTIHFRYRCMSHWRFLNEWLAQKGITDRKKVHTLRKLFGDAITKTQGIFAAAAQLRHTSLQVAVKHYTDPRQRAPLSISGLLTDQPSQSETDRETDSIIARLKVLPPDSLARVLAAIKTLASKSKARINVKEVQKTPNLAA